MHDLTFRQSLYSLFQWHNETLNVWTHLAGFVLFCGLFVYTTGLAGAARLPQPLVECAHATERAACLRSLALSTLSHSELARISRAVASLPASAAALPSRTLAALLGDAANTAAAHRPRDDGLNRALRHLASVRLPKFNVTLPRWLGARGRREAEHDPAPEAKEPKEQRSLPGRLGDAMLKRAQHMALPQLEVLMNATALGLHMTADSLEFGLNLTLDAAARGVDAAKRGEAYLHDAAVDFSSQLSALLKLSALIASLPDLAELADLQREANHVLTAFSEALHLPSLEAISPPALERWCARLQGALPVRAPCRRVRAALRRRPERSARCPCPRPCPRHARPIYFFLGSAMVCLAGSAIYHLFGTANSRWAGVLGTLDFIGITALIVGSFVPILFYGFYEQPFFRTMYITLICSLGGVLFVLALTPLFHIERYRELRTLLFTGLGLSGVVPVLHMLYHYDFNQLSRFVLVGTLLTGGAYLCGTAFYISRFPEVMAPGRFDLVLSSHNIWHVLVVCAACMHYAFVLELWYECSVAVGPLIAANSTLEGAHVL